VKCRLVILTEIISPYRIPLFNALATHDDLDLQVIFLAETDPHLRQWQVYRDQIRFPYVVLPSWRKRVGRYNFLLNRGVTRALEDAAPGKILCGGYNYVASWQALRWARSHNVPFLLWSESNLHDLRHGHAAVEFLKNRFLRKCAGFVVPGTSAWNYLRARGIREELIFTAPNAVDNDFFDAGARLARQNASMLRTELDLPNRYFLFVGRLVREKGVFDLLSAYAKLDDQTRQRVGLVFVGEGVARQQLEKHTASLVSGMIKFAGFIQPDQLAKYYALAEILILPTHTDTWGLVVNEAMACGLPVAVDARAGCAADLVKENWNGFLIPANDVSSLAVAMKSVASQPQLCLTMGANSARHILRYSPAEWAAGIARATASQAV